MIVVEELLSGVDAVVGMDIINQMGGVSIQQNKVTWGIETWGQISNTNLFYARLSR